MIHRTAIVVGEAQKPAPRMSWLCPCGHTSTTPWDPEDREQRMIELVCAECGEPYAGLVTADRGVYVRVGRITGC